MKPTIYISSAIYDFCDLRSALKFVLEQLGYTVLLSEFNDFTKPLEENSYKSCLAAIRSANYFILLVGSRVGGLYDAKDRISITRKEYHEAYELAKVGKLRLVTFVRKNIWDIREDRKALREYLISAHATLKELTKEEIEKIVNHPSAFVNDAEAIFGFLKEVGRVEEMKAASRGAGEFPKSNWIHTFANFHEIMAALNTDLNISAPLRQVAMNANLRHELISNLTKLLGKDSEGAIHVNCYFWPVEARKHFSGGRGGTSHIPARSVKSLGMYLIVTTHSQHMSNQFIDEALVSGEYLEFDHEKNEFRIGQLHQALLDLKDNIYRLLQITGPGPLAEERTKFLLMFKGIPEDETPIALENSLLVVPFAIQDRETNILTLTIAILKVLGGDASWLKNVNLKPSSPSEVHAKQIAKETVSVAEAENWLNSLHKS